MSEQITQRVFQTETPARTDGEFWYMPHHMVYHNDKCLFSHQGANLNDLHLPRPTLTSSMLGIMLSFRENSTAICSNI